MSKLQWLSRFFIPNLGPKPPKTPKAQREKAVLKRWLVTTPADGSATVEAHTKGEARAMAKAKLGFRPKQGLPAGTTTTKG